ADCLRYISEGKEYVSQLRTRQTLLTRFALHWKLPIAPQVQTFGTELERKNLAQVTVQNQRHNVPWARTAFGTLQLGAKFCAIRRFELGSEPLVRFTDNTFK